jgi:hypothetical protein
VLPNENCVQLKQLKLQGSSETKGKTFLAFSHQNASYQLTQKVNFPFFRLLSIPSILFMHAQENTQSMHAVACVEIMAGVHSYHTFLITKKKLFQHASVSFALINIWLEKK